MKELKKTESLSKKYSKNLSVINEHAAGIDIGDREHYIAIEKGDSYEVKRIGSFTSDLEYGVKWLKTKGIT